MKKEEGIEVIDLLRKYKYWVENGEIQFLEKDSDEQKNVLEPLGGLLSDFENAKSEVDDKRKKGLDVDLSDCLDWYETHTKGRDLWQKLASYALNDIDKQSKGNSQLFEFLNAATEFEELLYGLEPYYRDHTLHSLWVYFLGEYILREHLPEIRENLDWYLFNNIEDEEEKYKDREELVIEATRKEAEVRKKIDERKDAIWCIIALCHDLGYSLAKLKDINEKVQAVLRYFDIPDFKHIGYNLDVEHQYLVSQFLEIMAMDVRIVPSEDHRDREIDVKERVLIKCYRDDAVYWELCRALEKKQHGILSSYLVYKVVSMFAETWVRGSGEVWGLEDREVWDNIIGGNILYAMAQHTFEYNYLDELGSLADILILADELEEFSRYGRELLTRKYHDTMAKSKVRFTPKKPKPGEDIKIDIEYEVVKRDDLNNFFQRKTKRLCKIYSLKERQDQSMRRDFARLESRVGIKKGVIFGQLREKGYLSKSGKIRKKFKADETALDLNWRIIPKETEAEIVDVLRDHKLDEGKFCRIESIKITVRYKKSERLFFHLKNDGSIKASLPATNIKVTAEVKRKYNLKIKNKNIKKQKGKYDLSFRDDKLYVEITINREKIFLDLDAWFENVA